MKNPILDLQWILAEDEGGERGEGGLYFLDGSEQFRSDINSWKVMIKLIESICDFNNYLDNIRGNAIPLILAANQVKILYLIKQIANFR